MKENHKPPKATPTCRDCNNFSGLNPSFSPGAPLAWCHPHGNNSAFPCMPWENAGKKICFQPKK